MAEAIRHSPVYVQIGFNKRFYYGYRTARELMRAGRARRAHRVPGSVLVPARPRRPPAAQRHPLPRPGPVLHGSRRRGVRATGASRRRAPRRRPTPGPCRSRFGSGAVGNLLLSSLASWDYVNEHVDLVGSNHNVVSVENGRVVRVFRQGDESGLSSTRTRCPATGGRATRSRGSPGSSGSSRGPSSTVGGAVRDATMTGHSLREPRTAFEPSSCWRR